MHSENSFDTSIKVTMYTRLALFTLLTKISADIKLHHRNENHKF